MPGTYKCYYTQVAAPDWPHRAIYFTATREPSSPALPAFSSCGEWIFPTCAPDVPLAASAWAAQVLLRHARQTHFLLLRLQAALLCVQRVLGCSWTSSAALALKDKFPFLALLRFVLRYVQRDLICRAANPRAYFARLVLSVM